MNKPFIRFFAAVLLFFAAVPCVFAVDSELSAAVFRLPDGRGYVEVYQFFVGSTLRYAPVIASAPAGERQATVTMTLLFKTATPKGDSVIEAAKFSLSSPIVRDGGAPLNFADMRRFLLPAGKYTLEVRLEDATPAAANAKATATDVRTVTVVVPPAAAVPSLSGVELVGNMVASTDESAAYFKNGFIIQPRVLDYYAAPENQLTLYGEAYNLERAEGRAFTVRYYITPKNRPNRATLPLESQKTLTQAPDASWLVVGQQPLARANVAPFIATHDLTSVPSGSYLLGIELRDERGTLLAEQQTVLFRKNPYALQLAAKLQKLPATATFVAKLPADTVLYALKAMTALIPSTDLPAYDELIKSGTPEQLRQYLFAYWANVYPANPRAAYAAYMVEVAEIDAEYSSAMRRGYDSDRGRIRLRYGKPKSVFAQEVENGAVPYEIWTYEQVSQSQGFAKFIFYNPSLANNDFVLLHSTANGELHDSQWQRKLYSNSREKGHNYLQATEVDDQMGSNKASGVFEE